VPLKPIAEKARMIHRRFENIITYLRHRITNAASESIIAGMPDYIFRLSCGALAISNRLGTKPVPC
jgi:hypothetical protein